MSTHGHGYTLLRKDRLANKGGGIAAYCSNNLRFIRRPDLESASTEILWLEVFPYKSNRSLLMAGCYRPPSYTKDEDSEFEKCIGTADSTNKEIILTGDFNIDHNSPKVYNKHHLARNFKQLVDKTTRPISGTCLDHLYTNNSRHICEVLVFSAQ